jgi:hypothetical protein
MMPPRVVDEFDGPTNTSTAGIYWREMWVYGAHAYVVSEQTNVRGAAGSRKSRTSTPRAVPINV